jgi:hypothetical protein
MLAGGMDPGTIVASNGGVFWTEETVTMGAPPGVVMGVGRDGGAPSTLATDANRPASIAVDGASVYWLDGLGAGGSVMRVPIGGGNPVTLASSDSPMRAIAIDATSVYWIVQSTGAVMKLTPK